MTEQEVTDLEFEGVLERRLRARASLASRPFDAGGIAATAVVTRPSRRLELPVRLRAVAWGWVAVAALLAVMGATLAAGAVLHDWYSGPWLALATRDGIVLAHPDGTKPHRISAITSERPPGLRWSGDGRYLLVQITRDVEDGASMHYDIIDSEGRHVWSTDQADEVRWSSSGHRLAWTRYQDGDLVVTDVETGSTSMVLAGGESMLVRLGDWSPDDSAVMINRWDDAIDGEVPLMVPLAGGEPQRLAVDTSMWTSAGRWSPDGSRIAVMTQLVQESCTTIDTCPTKLVVYDTATGLPLEGISIRTFVTSPSWSPDGTRLAWDEYIAANGTETQVINTSTLPLDGRAHVVQAASLPGSSFLYGWMQDGQHLLVGDIEDVSGNGPWTVDLWRVNVEGSSPVLLVPDIRGAALQPSN
jgi:Tol biopolymer transport system component